jgi:hypothetical protein
MQIDPTGRLIESASMHAGEIENAVRVYHPQRLT